MQTLRNIGVLMDDRNSITKEFYEDRLAASEGIGWRASSWSSEVCQKNVFSALVRHIAIDAGDTILDVGCGVGDFWDYIKNDRTDAGQLDMDVSYHGIDLTESVIDVAQNKYPDGSFEAVDFLEYRKQHDWVLAGGTFNLSVPNQDGFIFGCLSHMFSLSKKGACVTLLSNSLQKNSMNHFVDLHYYDPARIFRYCSINLTPHVIVDQRGLDCQFLCCMFRD